jgi:hypothetical protein
MSYIDYCKTFIKSLKSFVNLEKGPCSAKRFDAMIITFAGKFYENHPELEHPFVTKQDACTFTYVVIMSIMATSITQEEFMSMASEVNVPSVFLQDMYSYIVVKRNLIKKGVVEKDAEGAEVIEKTDSALEIHPPNTDAKPIPDAKPATEQNSYCWVM